MLTKTALKELFLEHGFAPLKRFGENYLVDGNVKDKIIRQAGIDKNDTVLEIGPGFGALTIDLAACAGFVIAVEKDKKSYDILKEMTAGGPKNLKLYNKDILEFDLLSSLRGVPRLLSGTTKQSQRIKVVGNLPYYVTTPIVEYLIRHRTLISSALIVIQREVADRLLAKPGSKDYSSLSCFIQYHTKPKYLHTIKRTSFYPEPKVDSSLLRLEFLEKPSVDVSNEELFFRIVRGAFNQRRKTIMNSLSREEVLNLPKDQLTKTLENAHISPSSRPEDLSLSDFAKISNTIA